MDLARLPTVAWKIPFEFRLFTRRDRVCAPDANTVNELIYRATRVKVPKMTHVGGIETRSFFGI
jgi:hypothetical protein